MKYKILLIFCVSFYFLKSQNQGYGFEELVKFGSNDIRKIISVYRQKSKEVKYIKGYRIQLFSGNYSECKRVQERFQNEYPMITVIKKIENPFYKLWIGAFKDNFRANYELKRYRKKYPSSIIIPDKIYYSEL